MTISAKNSHLTFLMPYKALRTSLPTKQQLCSAIVGVGGSHSDSSPGCVQITIPLLSGAWGEKSTGLITCRFFLIRKVSRNKEMQGFLTDKKAPLVWYF